MSVRVFVVDDTPHVRKMLVQMLELSGFDVVGQAASGQEAVDSVDDADPQVVVVDYAMPGGLDGVATARKIRATRPDQAIILYTAFLDEKIEREAQEAGVALCVGKVEGLTTLERDIRRLAGELF
jgi:two-component system chemotaxis response regulator CheY